MYRKILKQYWGYDDFRGIQEEIIESIGNGKDTLGLMPTGGGKSITFQVQAIAKDGVCIVITPLIALMKDQVQSLRQRGIMATAAYSGMTRNEIITAYDNCILGDIKLLYISPERLSSPIFRSKVTRMKVSFITVDEAHCISQWGYDFRPSYLNIAEIRKLIPEVPVLALTATATPNVIIDIQEKLDFRKENVFRMSFERKNLSYVVRTTSDKNAELVHILSSVKGSAIVYTRSRKGSKDIARLLCANEINATYYHAGLENAVKDQRQQQWQNDDVRVMVATNAFGMGIDKSDVRLVIHIDCPDSIEAYFQEAGRAGRDGMKAWAVLLYNNHDEIKLKRRIGQTYPEKELIREVYEHLSYFYQIAMGFGRGQTYAFDIEKFCHTYRFFPVLVDSALKILDHAGYIVYETDPDTKSRLMITLARKELSELESLTPKEEDVMTAMMRIWGGLFTDYCYIDESAISISSGLDRNVVYLILKGLSKRHIVHYIPQRKIPLITFVCERVEKDQLIMKKDIYEQRKEQMAKNINAVVNYARSEAFCRSELLLRYFGETVTMPCGHCDVCRNNAGEPTKEALAIAQNAILKLVADRKPHHFTELNSILLPRLQMDTALKLLIDEEQIIVCNNTIAKA